MLEQQFYLFSVFALILGILSFLVPREKIGIVLAPGLALLSTGLWTILALSAVAIEIPVDAWLWNTNTSNATLSTATVTYQSLNVHWIYYMFAIFFLLWFLLLCVNSLMLLGEESRK